MNCTIRAFRISGHCNNGNAGDIRLRSLPLPPDVVPMGILVAIGMCLATHKIVTLVFFQYVLYGVDRFRILFWCPVMLAEIIVFLMSGVRKRKHGGVSEALTDERVGNR